MRHLSLALALGGLLLAVGCNQFQPMKAGPAPQPAAVRPQEAPSAAALVAYLNDNARRIQTLDCSDLDLDAKQKMQSVGLRGWLVCEKPRNFRLAAKVLGKQELDMGSNANEFWFWVARGDPYLFHCAYADLNAGRARLPFPFQPEWIMQALGMADYGAPENYRVTATPTTLELIEEVHSPQGAVTGKRVTVFNRRPAVGNQPQVLAHLLLDPNGKEICAANISEVQQDRATGAIIPKQVRLVWPAEHMELKMRLDNVTIKGALPEQQVVKLFTRPRMSGVETYDLARGREAPPDSIRRTGAVQQMR
jgi:hypothetical protein